MDFEPNEDQAAVLDGLEQLIGSLAPAAPTEGVFSAFSPELDHELAEAGFLGIAREQGFSTLEAALIVERIARLPVSAETAASALVAPLFIDDPALRPVALAAGSPTAPARFLPHARALLVDLGDDVLLVTTDPARIEPVESLFAYPYGRLSGIDRLETKRLGAEAVAPLRRRWRMALAIEAAGLMAAALAAVIDHVKTRQQFGRPLGSFQALHHRLAMAAATAEATRWLAFRAAWSDADGDAATAAGYAQDAIPRFTYDLHQFCGAMGLTLEFTLHHWTYRLKALLGEVGGSSGQARAAAGLAWAKAA